VNWLSQNAQWTLLAALAWALPALPTWGQQQGFLGAQIRTLTPQLAAELSLEQTQGILVVDVLEGGPAALAGLRAGDVIVSFVGVPITEAPRFARLVSELPPQSALQLDLVRGTQPLRLTITLGVRPATTPSASSGQPARELRLEHELPPQPEAPASSSGSDSGRVNIKPWFLTDVRSYMTATQGTGLSSRFFSVGDPGLLIGEVTSYILGVAVDPTYLSNFKLAQYVSWHPSKEDGLCQPKHQWWTSAVTPQERRYNGWIILARDPDTDSMTAFHEAIHAFHLSIGSNVDEDAYNGPEYISNNLSNIVINLRDRIDPEVERLERSRQAGQDIQRDLGLLYRRLRILRNQTANWTPQFHECLRNIGGRMEWEAYEAEIRRRLGSLASPGAFRAGDGALIHPAFADGDEATATTLKASNLSQALRRIMGDAVRTIQGENPAPWTGMTLQVFLLQSLTPDADVRQLLSQLAWTAQTQERTPSREIVLTRLGQRSFRASGGKLMKQTILEFQYREEFTGLLSATSTDHDFPALTAEVRRFLAPSLKLIDERFPRPPAQP